MFSWPSTSHTGGGAAAAALRCGAVGTTATSSGRRNGAATAAAAAAAATASGVGAVVTTLRRPLPQSPTAPMRVLPTLLLLLLLPPPGGGAPCGVTVRNRSMVSVPCNAPQSPVSKEAHTLGAEQPFVSYTARHHVGLLCAGSCCWFSAAWCCCVAASQSPPTATRLGIATTAYRTYCNVLTVPDD